MTATVSGHFGELLQGRLGPAGPLALVTLPAPPLRVAAELLPGAFAVRCVGGAVLDRPTALALHRSVAGGPPRGRLVLRSAMPPGGGAGSSTAALVAAASVYAAGAGRPLPESEALARLCVRLEGASDPLMHPDPRLLWAPRNGTVLARLPPLPALALVGGFLGPGIRTDPADLDFADVADLARLGNRPPCAATSLPWHASRPNRRSATRRAAAARRSRQFSRPRRGSARGLLFAPGSGACVDASAALATIGLTGLLQFRLGPGPASR